ncbi:MAG: hypothetical protein WBA66_12475 [Xanthobacteraceae bacterium]
METTIDWGAIPIKSAFSYSALSSDIADRLRRQAERIRERVARTAQDMIETGRDLAAVKSCTEHGTFTAWVEAECGITPRLAQMYMRAAEWASDKSEIVSLLQPTAILKLSAKSTPNDIQLDVIERVRSGVHVTPREIDGMLYTARKEKKERERHERMSPATRKKREAERIARAEREQEQKRQREETQVKNRDDAKRLTRILVSHVPHDQINDILAIMLNVSIFDTQYQSGLRTPSQAYCALKDAHEANAVGSDATDDDDGGESHDPGLREKMSAAFNSGRGLPAIANGDPVPQNCQLTDVDCTAFAEAIGRQVQATTTHAA